MRIVNDKPYRTWLHGILVLGSGVLFGIFASVGLHYMFVWVDNADLRETSSDNKPLTSFSSDQDPTFDSEVNSLFDLTRYHGGFSRQVALYNFLARHDKTGILNLLEKTKHPDFSNNYQRDTTQRALFQFLAEIDPREALKQLDGFTLSQQKNFLQDIYDVWCTENLDELVRHLPKEERWKKRLALRSIADLRDDLSEPQLNKISRRLKEESYLDVLIAGRQATEKVGSGTEVWQSLIDDDVPDFLQTSLLIDAATSVATEHSLSGLFDTLQLDVTRADHYQIANTVLRELATENPARRFEEFLERERFGALDIAFSIRNASLYEWAKFNPETALAAVSEAGLDDFDGKFAMESLVDGWVATDPMGLFEALDTLPSWIQSYARRKVATKIGPEDPEAGIEILKSMQGEMVEFERQIYLELLVQVWTTLDFDKALNFALTDEHHEHMRAALVGAVVRQLAQSDPERAFSLALENLNLGIPEFTMQPLDVLVIEVIAQHDVDTAAALLPQVTEESRLSAFNVIGRGYLMDHQSKASIALGNQLPQTEREEYFEELLKFWAYHDPEELYSKINQLPSDTEQSRAAHWLLHFNEWRGILTKEQIRRSKNLLN